MASAAALPLKSITAVISVAVVVAGAKTNLRALFAKIFTGPGNKSRIFALVLALMNVKVLPFVWHYRVWNAILGHNIFFPPNIPPALKASSLFLPAITSTHSGLYESDYNLHKSNSTYFADLDVSRSHLGGLILQPGGHALRNNATTKIVLGPSGTPVKGRFGIMLGSVMCSFKREIGIYQPFEMWTRLLCWDRKWIYMVTHFVKKGTVRPRAYVLTDGSWWGGQKAGYQRNARPGTDEYAAEKAIFATAVSKYVLKLGRLTIHPEVCFDAGGMLPARPGGWAKMQGGAAEAAPVVVGDDVVPASEGEEWNWKRVEEMNARGLKFAEHFAELDGLHGEFSGGKTAALGKYRDLFFV